VYQGTLAQCFIVNALNLRRKVLAIAGSGPVAMPSPEIAL